MTRPLSAHQKRLARRAAQRRARMLVLKAQGWTLEKIGAAYGGISKQRVAAILKG
jgi:hypothetical protein